MFVGTAATIESWLKTPDADESALVYVPHQSAKFSSLLGTSPFLPPVSDFNSNHSATDDFLSYQPLLTWNMDLDPNLNIDFDFASDALPTSEDWPTWPELRDMGDSPASTASNDEGDSGVSETQASSFSNYSSGLDPNFGLGSTGANGEARSVVPPNPNLPLEPTPEPSTYVMLLGGLTVLGVTYHRRKSRA
jgi:hypothetical protein